MKRAGFLIGIFMLISIMAFGLSPEVRKEGDYTIVSITDDSVTVVFEYAFNDKGGVFVIRNYDYLFGSAGELYQAGVSYFPVGSDESISKFGAIKVLNRENTAVLGGGDIEEGLIESIKADSEKMNLGILYSEKDYVVYKFSDYDDFTKLVKRFDENL